MKCLERGRMKGEVEEEGHRSSRREREDEEKIDEEGQWSDRRVRENEGKIKQEGQ